MEKRKSRRAFWRLIGVAIFFGLLPPVSGPWCQSAPAQESVAPGEDAEIELPLLEQEPFDRITLDEANNSAVLRVLPVELPGRKKPLNPQPQATLRIRLIDEDEGEYQVAWRNIKRLEFFEEMLLAEAERLTAARQFDEAFRYYYRVRRDYPGLDGLDTSYNRYLYLDAVQLTRDQRFPEAMGVVEELSARNPSFRYSENAPAISDFLGGLLDRIIQGYFTEQRHGLARSLLQRMQRDYGPRQPAATQKWISELRKLAEQKRDQARQLLEARQYREALQVSKQMVDTWPDVPGAPELQADLAARYPMVLVGVLQPAVMHDSTRLDNWSARRTGQLVYQSLVEFLGAGPEGGQYEFALGLIQRSDDGRRLTLRIRENASEPDVDGYQIGRRLLEMADPQSPEYISTWGGLVSRVHVQGVTEVQVDLQRSHVLPEALLRVPLRGGRGLLERGERAVTVPVSVDDGPPLEALGPGDGPFEIAQKNAEQVQFVNKDFAPGDLLAEIVEVTYPDSSSALSALRRGEVDVIDRLFPSDAARLLESLSADSPLRVERYALPTVHLLLINEDNIFLANRDFRRALTFGIDRERILRQELLGGRQVEGCRLISGPFPAGADDRDPLGYAYDVRIANREYTPYLAKLLTIVAKNHIDDLAENRGEDPPVVKPLLLGHPAHEAARVAARAIADQLRPIGIECELKEFPPGLTRDPEGACDLTYAEIAVWEPVVDAHRLFAQGGIAPTANPYVNQALRRLSLAQSWGDVRERLLDLHRTIHNEATVIPLWQTVDFFAYHERLKNIGESPVWLYQSVDQWRVGAGDDTQ